MIEITSDSGVRWCAEDWPDRIVVAIDLHGSIDRRTRENSFNGREQLEHYSSHFLLHNAIVYSHYEKLDKDAEAVIADFVADSALITFSKDAISAALKFAFDVVKEISENDLETSVGIDSGAVAIYRLFDSGGADTNLREAIGIPVDRAVRLSWIADPGQVLIRSSLLEGDPSPEFESWPDAVRVSLDKWHNVSLQGYELLKVKSLYPHGTQEGTVLPPSNTRRFLRSMMQLRVIFDDLIHEEPNLPSKWSILETVLDGSQGNRKRSAIKAMKHHVEHLRGALEWLPPECELQPSVVAARTYLTDWCTSVEHKLTAFGKDLSSSSSASWTNLAPKSDGEALFEKGPETDRLITALDFVWSTADQLLKADDPAQVFSS